MSTDMQNCEASTQPLLVNGCANKPVARQWLSSRHVMAATDARNNRRAVFCAVIAEAI
jgi:hypothetical protein